MRSTSEGCERVWKEVCVEGVEGGVCGGCGGRCERVCVLSGRCCVVCG